MTQAELDLFRCAARLQAMELVICQLAQALSPAQSQREILRQCAARIRDLGKEQTIPKAPTPDMAMLAAAETQDQFEAVAQFVETLSHPE